MTQREAVIRTMGENEGYATLGYLYKNVFNIRGCKWGTKTPQASIRRIVQDNKYFFKIKPGLWGLNSYKDKLPDTIKALIEDCNKEFEKRDLSHSYYQGLIVEIGNIKNYNTYIPNQDKNKVFLNKKLCEISRLRCIFNFSYDYFVRKAETIDVTWFNNRNMPHSFFEVEHSTNIQTSLLKFMELQDFNVKFYIVASSIRESLFKDKISQYTFQPIRKRVKFIDYESIVKLYDRNLVERDINL